MQIIQHFTLSCGHSFPAVSERSSYVRLILYFGPVILVVLLVLLIITQGYVKAPPDHAYIISGLRKEPRVLVAAPV